MNPRRAALLAWLAVVTLSGCAAAQRAWNHCDDSDPWRASIYRGECLRLAPVTAGLI